MKIVEVSGDGRARGRAHGEALRDMIHEHLARWREALAADVAVDPDRYVDEFLADTDFLPAAERWTPDLLAEVRGVSEAAGADWRYTLVRQLSDEEPWYRRARKLGAWPGRGAIAIRENSQGVYGDARPETGCSSIGLDARDGRAALIAQNMDTPRWYDGHQILLKAHDPRTGVTALVFTVAGKISLAGMNDHGLAIACNTLSQLDYDPRGLAEDFVVRGYLAHADRAAGLAFLKAVPHASGQNYTVPGPDGAALNLECSKGGVVAWRPWAGADRVFHTNHPLASADTGLYEAQMAEADAAMRAKLTTSTSRARLAALEARLGPAAGRLSADDAKAALASSDGPVCVTGADRREGYTLGCLLMRLETPPVLEVAPGPPDVTPFETIRF